MTPRNSSMASISHPILRRTRGLPRRDYNALHNGLVSSSSEQSEESIGEIESPFSPEPSLPVHTDETPQSKRFYSLVSSSPSPLDPAFLESSGDTASPLPSKRRKTKSYSSWTVEHFWTTDLDSTWCRRDGPPKKDRLLVCKHCNWSSRDSARYGSTSNLLVHLQTKHHIKSGTGSIFLPAAEGNIDQINSQSRGLTDIWKPRERIHFTKLSPRVWGAAAPRVWCGLTIWTYLYIVLVGDCIPSLRVIEETVLSP